jgi:tRNA-dihydrouridine synthase B
MRKRMARLISERPAATDFMVDGPWPLAEPFAIGGVTIPNRVIQAPLAGIANWAFRGQSRRHGAGMAVSEMVASMGIVHGNDRTDAMYQTARDEAPVAIQLFGAEPAAMAEAARVVAEAGADIIDINMGCPVRKVCSTGAGAALLTDPAAGAAVVEAMVAAVSIPVTVKMRRGMTPATADPVGAARTFVDAGAAAIFFHPRTASDQYEGRADHTYTAEVAAAVDVPVIASGDIDSPAEAYRVMRDHGATAVAIGRAALGNPWLYGEIARGQTGAPRTLDVIVAEVAGFAAAIVAAIGEHRGCAYMRKFYPWYLAGHEVSAAERERMLTAPTLDEALTHLRDLAHRRLKPAA